jgi:hypothetical protein
VNVPRVAELRPVLTGVLLVGVILGGASCEREEPTTDLKLVLAKPASHLFNPIPSPDGQVVYFLEANYDSADDNVFNAAGEVRGVTMYTGVDWPVLEGGFGRLCLSSDGTRLAAARWFTGDSTCPIVVADTLGTVLDSIVVPVTAYTLSDVHFSLTGDAVFYMVYRWADSGEVQSRVYRRGLGGDTATTVAAEYLFMVQRFALLPGDSILVDASHGGYELAACPTDTRWVISAERPQNIFVPWKWRVTDRSTGEMSHLSTATLPEDMTYLDWPAWMPNGKDLLFGTGMKYGPEGMHSGPAQLWRLEKALDYRR